MSEVGLTAKRWRALACTLALAALMPVQAWAQNTIRSISSTQQSGSDVVRIELAQPLKELPRGFAVQVPPRIALDLPGVGNGLGRSAVEINTGNMRSANVAQAGDRTRVVLNLRHRLPPRHRRLRPRRRQSAQQPVGVDIQQQGKTLVVDFLRSNLPERLRRKLDVTDFGTPVQTVVASQAGDRGRLVVTPKGDWEHSAYQSDNQFVLEVRPQKVDPNKLTQGPGYNGDKLSLNFQNIEVRALLQVIADFTNFNVVTSDTVSGNVTLRLKDVPWDQALDIIMQAKNLGMRKNGSVLRIAPEDELNAKDGGNYSAVGSATNQQATYQYADSQFVNLPANVSSDVFGQQSAANFAPVAVQRDRQPLPEPGDLRAGGRRPRQGGVQPARGDGGPDQGADRAGRGNPVSAGHFQRRDLHQLQEGRAEAGSDAADHARGQRHPDRGRQQGQPRHADPAGLRDQQQARADAGAGGERRHRRDRRHLHAGRPGQREQGPVPGRHSVAGQSVQEQDTQHGLKRNC
ncbi:AMIN domain-containing protein [Ditylenchus destructor]|nr:AMIN domain-containing protein [Ditylenchus destructor]